VVTKIKFDDKDKAAILKYMRASSDEFPDGYPEVLTGFIESMPLDDLKTMLSSVESRSIDNAAPSLRAWADVAKAMIQVEDQALRGDLPDDEWERDLRSEHATLKEIEKRVWSIPDNWAGFLGDQTVTVGDDTFTVPEGVEEIKGAMVATKKGTESQWLGEPQVSPDKLPAIVKDMNDYLDNLASINEEVRAYREQEFLSKFGKRYTRKFMPYYNKNVGKVFLHIKDVVSAEIAWKYGEQLLSGTAHPNEKRDALLAFMEDFYSTFKGRGSASLFADVLDVVVERMPAPDMTLDLLLLYTKPGYDLVRGFLNRALNAQNTMRYSKLLYLVSLKKEDVEAYYQAGMAPTGTDGYPPVVAGGTS
jgi:hypothetical protein